MTFPCLSVKTVKDTQPVTLVIDLSEKFITLNLPHTTVRLEWNKTSPHDTQKIKKGKR